MTFADRVSVLDDPKLCGLLPSPVSGGFGFGRGDQADTLLFPFPLLHIQSITIPAYLLMNLDV